CICRIELDQLRIVSHLNDVCVVVDCYGLLRIEAKSNECRRIWNDLHAHGQFLEAVVVREVAVLVGRRRWRPFSLANDGVNCRDSRSDISYFNRIEEAADLS